MLTSLLHNFASAQTDEQVEFSLDNGESIQAEDPSKMESIDSTEFDKAFEDPRAKKKKRSRKAIRRAKRVVSKRKAPKSKKLTKTNDRNKVEQKNVSTKSDAKSSKASPSKEESYFDRVLKVVKVEYKKAKVKATDLFNKLKKKWDLSK